MLLDQKTFFYRNHFDYVILDQNNWVSDCWSMLWHNDIPIWHEWNMMIQKLLFSGCVYGISKKTKKS